MYIYEKVQNALPGTLHELMERTGFHEKRVQGAIDSLRYVHNKNVQWVDGTFELHPGRYVPRSETSPANASVAATKQLPTPKS